MTLEKQIEIMKGWAEKASAQMAFPVLFEKDIARLLEWLEDYKQLKETTRLIPRSERMPDKDGYYLCVSNGEFKILPYGNGEFYSKCFDGALRCCNSSVTRWMPLPSKDELNET